MFVDKARIYVQAGNGGKGCESFYHARGMRNRKRDGGDGGPGGDIVITADSNLHTLLDFRYRQHFKAESGAHGSSNLKTGRAGADRIIKVPPGTIIRDAEHKMLIRDLDAVGDRVIAAKGGNGGTGNGKRRGATEGQPGQQQTLLLELKLIADVGIIGYPNAGKSSFLNLVCQSRSKVGAFPFTTLAPQLGVATTEDGQRCVIADIPGIIENAHSGKGLGLEFLRHVERTKVLLFLVDLAGVDGRDPGTDYMHLRRELEQYDRRLLEKEYVVAANKIDLPQARPNLKTFRAQTGGIEILEISCLTGSGTDETVRALCAALDRHRQREQEHEGAEE